MIDPHLIAFVQRAVQSLEGLASPGADAASSSLTVVLAGAAQGAVHLFVPAEHATPEQAERFAAALAAAALAEPLSTRALWAGVTRGPHAGERLDALVLALEPTAAHEPVQIGQSITAAQELSEQSVMAITNEMRSIWELARTQSESLTRVASQFAETGEAAHANVASTIDQLAAQMRTFGQEILERTQRQAHDIDQARGWTNDIMKLGQAISAIASNARLLTFNARLESARIGEAGRGFAVIAGSIQELATQVRQTNNSVAHLAQNLAAALPRLNADALQTSRAAEVSVAEIETRLLDVQGRINGMRTESWEALSDSSSAAKELQTRADQVLEHLQFQDRASQMLEQARTEAASVLAAAGLAETASADVQVVGALGRQIGGEVTHAPGSVEVF